MVKLATSKPTLQEKVAASKKEKKLLPPPMELSDSEEDEDIQQSESDDQQSHDDEGDKDSDLEIAAQEGGDFEAERKERFGLRAINDREGMTKRLNEIRANFYNRLSSQKLVNAAKGRIPFSEHMTISKCGDD
jgi:hypothetical protein